MNLHNDWMSDNSLFGDDYSKNLVINKAKERFDIQRFYSSEGADVVVDGVDCRALVQYFTNPLNQAKYDRKLHVPMEINISTGSIVEFDGFKWIVTGSIDDIQAYKTAGMTKTNQTLKFYDKNHILYQIPCIVDSNTRFQDLRLEENKFITEPDDKITIRIAYNDITKSIERGQIFKLIDNDNYKVISVNKVTEPGLIVLKMEFEIQEQILPSYSLEILNGESINLQQGNTVQLNIQVKDDTTILPSPPPYLFTSSDQTICQVSDSGIVTSVGVGNATITCKLQNDETVYDSISIAVEEVSVVDQYIVSISGATTVKLNSNIILTANVLNNGIVDTTKSVEWSINNQDISSNQYVSIVSQDGTNITLKATSNSSYVGKYVVIRASMSGDLSVYSEHLVQIKSIF